MRVKNPRLRQWLVNTTAALAAVAVLPANAYAVAKTPFGKKEAPPGENLALTADQSFSYDTNPLRLVNGAKVLSGSVTTFGALLNSHTDTRTAQLNSIISRGIYDDSNFDTTNAHEILTLAKKNERWNVGLDSRLDYETTRTTEITSFGITAPNVRNIKLAATPEIRFRATPLNTLSVRGTILNSTFDNAGFTDYRLYEVNPSLRHRFDPRNTGVVNFKTQRYETLEGVKTTTDAYGPTLGWIWEYSDNLTARLNAGAQRSTQERANRPRNLTQTSYVYSGDFTYSNESTLSELIISRAQQPSGNGISLLLTSIDLNESYLINDRVSLKGGLGYRMATYVGNPGTNLDNQYSANGGLAYRLLDEVDATARYEYIHQKLTSNAGTLGAHTVLLGLTYHPSEFEF